MATSFFNSAFYGGEFFNSSTPPVEPPVTIPDRPGHFVGQSATPMRGVDIRTRSRLRDDEEIFLLLMGEI